MKASVALLFFSIMLIEAYANPIDDESVVTQALSDEKLSPYHPISSLGESAIESLASAIEAAEMENHDFQAHHSIQKRGFWDFIKGIGSTLWNTVKTVASPIINAFGGGNSGSAPDTPPLPPPTVNPYANSGLAGGLLRRYHHGHAAMKHIMKK